MDDALVDITEQSIMDGHRSPSESEDVKSPEVSSDNDMEVATDSENEATSPSCPKRPSPPPPPPLPPSGGFLLSTIVPPPLPPLPPPPPVPELLTSTSRRHQRDRDTVNQPSQSDEASHRTAEQERLQRQQWAEEQYMEAEVARRIEKHIAQLVQAELHRNADEIAVLVAERVAQERERIELAAQEEEERQLQRELEEQKRREEEEKRLRDENERLQKEMERALEEQKLRKEEERRRLYEEQLRELTLKQRQEEEARRLREKELEVILNKKRSRPKICMTLKK